MPRYTPAEPKKAPITNEQFKLTARQCYEELDKVTARYRERGVGTYLHFSCLPTSEQAVVEVKLYPDR